MRKAIAKAVSVQVSYMVAKNLDSRANNLERGTVILPEWEVYAVSRDRAPSGKLRSQKFSLVRTFESRIDAERFVNSL